MITVLKTLKNEFLSLNIPYYFDDWTSKLQLPYFVGEISEVPTIYEDGKREFNFILTGEDAKSYTKLFNLAEKLKNEYKQNKKILTENGIMVVSYENMITIPIEAQSVKRIQINLTIYLWEGK